MTILSVCLLLLTACPATKPPESHLDSYMAFASLPCEEQRMALQDAWKAESQARTQQKAETAAWGVGTMAAGVATAFPCFGCGALVVSSAQLAADEDDGETAAARRNGYEIITAQTCAAETMEAKR